MEGYEYLNSSGKAKQEQSETGSTPPQNICSSVAAVFSAYIKPKHFVWNDENLFLKKLHMRNAQ